MGTDRLNDHFQLYRIEQTHLANGQNCGCINYCVSMCEGLQRHVTMLILEGVSEQERASSCIHCVNIGESHALAHSWACVKVINFVVLPVHYLD